MSHLLCDFIDAGSGIECSDKEIRGPYITPFDVHMEVFEI